MNKLCSERSPNRPTPPIKEIWVSTWLLLLSTHLLLTQASPHWCAPPCPTLSLFQASLLHPKLSESSYQPPAQAIMGRGTQGPQASLLLSLGIKGLEALFLQSGQPPPSISMLAPSWKERVGLSGFCGGSTA